MIDLLPAFFENKILWKWPIWTGSKTDANLFHVFDKETKRILIFSVKSIHLLYDSFCDGNKLLAFFRVFWACLAVSKFLVALYRGISMEKQNLISILHRQIDLAERVIHV